MAYDHPAFDKVSEWRDLAAIETQTISGTFILGLKNDGTVEAVRSDSTSYLQYGQDKVSGWTDITDIVGDTYTTIGLKKDGTLVLAGYDSGCNLTVWG